MVMNKCSDAVNILAATASKAGVLLLALVFSINAFGLRLHDHHEHASDSDLENCARHFCAAAFQPHQHDDCADTDFCEHSHQHSPFLLCDIAPVLPTPSNELAPLTPPAAQSNDLFFLMPANQVSLKNYCDVFSLCPRSGPGRVCPVTGLQLPLLR
jgi:hypothetical protein